MSYIVEDKHNAELCWIDLDQHSQAFPLIIATPHSHVSHSIKQDNDFFHKVAAFKMFL